MGSITRSFANNITTAGKFDGTKLTGDIPVANLSANAPAFDDDKIVNDLSTLGLRVHTQENLSASNTNSQYVDVFQDASGYTNGADTVRDSAEYVASVSETSTPGFLSTSNTTYYSAHNVIDNEDSSNNHSRHKFNNASASGNWCNFSNTAVLTGNFTFQYKVPAYGYNGNGDPTNNYWFQFGVAENTTNLIVNNSIYNRANSNGQTGLWLGNQGNGQSQFRIFQGTGSGVTTLHDINGITLAENDVLQWSRSGSTFTIKRNGSAVQEVSGFTSSANMFCMVGCGYNGTYDVQNQPQYLEMGYVAKTLTANATGNFSCPAITAGSSTSKMGAVITYQDHAGTNALNTDIVLQLSADNGSNFSTATLTALPDFSSGIKMAKVNDLSVTAGTQLKYKISFANQAQGSKEARIRGVSLNY